MEIRQLEWRLNDLEKKVNEISRKVARNSKNISDMLKADEIADAVAKKVKEDKSTGLNFYQKLGAGLAGFIILADSLRGLIQHL